MNKFILNVVYHVGLKIPTKQKNCPFPLFHTKTITKYQHKNTLVCHVPLRKKNEMF